MDHLTSTRLTYGRIVHYVIADEDSPAASAMLLSERHRAAIVTDGYFSLDGKTIEPSLTVFLTSADQVPGNFLFVESVAYSNSNEPGTWHWPEKA